MPILHICRGCGEAWGAGFIHTHRNGFDVDAQSKEVTRCPSCRDMDDSFAGTDNEIEAGEVC